MTLFPFIKNKVILDTNPKKFFNTLKKLCEDDFDILRTQKTYDTLYKPDYSKEYEAEITTNSFKARKLEKRGIRKVPYIKNTVYGWYKAEGNKLVFKYVITFNIFTGLLFIVMLVFSAKFLYDAFVQFNSSSWNSLFYGIIGPGILIFVFNMMAEDDKMFIDELIKKSTATATNSTFA